MSGFRRPSAIAKKNKVLQQTYVLPIKDVPKARRPYGMPHIISRPEGRIMTPEGLMSQVLPDNFVPMPEAGDVGVHSHVEVGEGEENAAETHKKKLQWRRWSEEVIPKMLEPYLEILRKTNGLQSMEDIRKEVGCAGCVNGRKLEISCVYFERIEKIMVCNCSSIALQLLSWGLFPCAPLEPSLAVDLNVLDFARELFVNAPPNLTAWCETLEGFLSSRKFKLKTRDSLRGRFGNALHWYSTLINTKNLHMRDYLEAVREAIITTPGVDDEEGIGEETEVLDEPMETLVAEDQQGSDHEMDDSTGEPTSGLDRPSEYLRERCPLCFGGENWSKADQIVDSIVCLDACFTQKRRKTNSKAWQGPRVHPETIFLPTEDVENMEAFVEEVRPTKAKSSKTAKAREDEEPDYETGMKVPTSVLNECNDSFVAADERRVKASTQFFTDTGLMALLCRHDRVLWLANLTSAGEKQHYALALLAKLFENIPESMRIGVLYDIGCQLHRSCKKYGFLQKYLDRMVFGISVFHAYGHQWPCQIIYHPRKCEGFGLTDGEGCERFWSSIKGLIPSCRVSGYFTRIYALDTQVKHLDFKSLLGLGNWLERKWLATQSKKEEALLILEEIYASGLTKEDLKKEWKAQVAEQTKPLKRQSKTLADKEIQEILVLMKNEEELKADVEGFENMIRSGTYEEGLTLYDVQTGLEEAKERLKKTKGSILYKRGKLSVDGRLSLKKLIGNEFLQKRMNALALKQRIRDRLRNRKFEMEMLERAYRNTVNHAKLEKHATHQIKRKEPGIQALARNYNRLCDELSDLIKKKKAPLGAVAPLQIVYAGLFQLDVDDEIWQDIGLTEDGDASVNIPRWLGDENVRSGIKAMLQHDRCVEEEKRLKSEVVSMHQWFREEWSVVTTAMAWSQNDEKVVFQLQERKDFLLKLLCHWRSKVKTVPILLQEPWGPSDKEYMKAKQYEQTESVIYRDRAMDDDDIITGKDNEEPFWPEDDLEEMHDAELIDSFEHMFV